VAHLAKVLLKPASMIKRFAIGGLIASSLVSVIFGSVFFNFIRQHIMERDAQVSLEFVQSISQIHNPEPYFLNQKTLNYDDQLEKLYQHIVQMQDVLRASIYTADGKVYWSSNGALIGKQFDDNTQLFTALNGQLSFNWEDLDDTNKEEHFELYDISPAFIEIYIPIWNNMGTEVLGVVEIYKAPAAILQVLARGYWQFLIAVVLAGALIYLLLFWFFRYINGLLQVQQKAIMQAENLAALGEMVAIVTHSTRGPLSNIRATAELAQLEISEGSEALQAFMNDIIADTDRLDLRLRELLTAAYAQDDSPPSADICSVVENSLNSCQQRLQRTQVNVVSQVDAGLPAVRAKPELLQHVLIDLIANALEAMPRGGQLSIKATPSNGFIVLQLMDTGVGMSSDQMAQAFRPLSSTKSSGIGLGLTLTKRVLQRYGGTLELSSRGKGNGVTVQLQLPIAERV